MYLSITGVTSNKKLAKYQPFELEADAIAHATKYGGFSVADIGGNQKFWIVDKAKKQSLKILLLKIVLLLLERWNILENIEIVC